MDRVKRTREEPYVLPELSAGQRIRLDDGKGHATEVRLVGNGKTDPFGAPLFHLQYSRREAVSDERTWRMPGIVSDGTYTRDRLQQLGAVLVSRQRGA